MKSYLLIDSTYRNRLQYPNPADFEVPFQTVNSYQNSTVFTSVNPISVYPDYNFQFIPGAAAAATTTDTTTAAAAPEKVSMSDFVLDSIIDRNAPHDGSFVVQAADPATDATAEPAATTDTTDATAAPATTTDTTTAAPAAAALTFDAATVITGNIIGGSTKMPVIDGAVASAFGISVPNTTNSVYTGIGSAVGLLKGLVFYYNNVNVPFPITGYDPINSIVFLENGIPNFSIPSTYTIHNPSTSSAIYIHGDVGNRSSIVNFNSELYLYDIALNEMNLVDSFDYGNNILNLSKPFSKSWAASDPYMLMSKETIANYGRIQPFANNKYTLQTIMKYRVTNAGTGYKAGDIVFVSNTGNDYKTSFHFHVTHIFPDTSIRTMEMLDIGSTNYTASTSYALHRENETTTTGIAQILVEETTTAFYCSFVNPRQNLDGFFFPLLLSQQFTVRDSALYVSGNGTIPFKNPRHTPVDIMNSFYTNGVSGIKKVIPISPTEAYILVQSYPSDMLSRFDLIPAPIPDPILGCTDFLILPFSREGVIGLNMTGTLLTQSQSSCYRMSVISLILPNLTIDMNTGPLTSALPFVYLEVSNVSSSNGRNRSVIYSNNPYSTNATFICSVSDVNSPLVTQFIKINSDGAVQTIKFSPIDTLRFRVSLYNGQTFETERKDYLVPVQPDPRVQISAMIEIERIA